MTMAHRNKLERLYIENVGYLKELIHSDPRTSIFETEKILNSIVSHLDDYDGPLTDKAFRDWATKVLLPVLGLYGIKHAYTRPVRDAIRKVFIGYEWRGDIESARDDAEQDLWIWAILHLEKLLKPDANSSSWLKEIAKFKAMTIRTTMIRGNKRFSPGVDMERVGRDYANAVVIQPFHGTRNDQFDENHQQPYSRIENIK
jgi:hypothetical protein